MSDKTKKYFNTFKTEEEFKAYIEAQQQSFIEVSKKVKSLEDENEALKKKIEKLQLEQSKPESKSNNLSNAEIICLTQINLLKNLSDERVLTLEETRKAEILIKLLSIFDKKLENNESYKDIDTDKLLKLIKNE